MAFRCDEKVSFTETVICDDYKKEVILMKNIQQPFSFDTRMNYTLANGFTFKTYGGREIRNYCKDCKSKYETI